MDNFFKPEIEESRTYLEHHMLAGYPRLAVFFFFSPTGRKFPQSYQRSLEIGSQSRGNLERQGIGLWHKPTWFIIHLFSLLATRLFGFQKTGTYSCFGLFCPGFVWMCHLNFN